jgi:hypothetical protein
MRSFLRGLGALGLLIGLCDPSFSQQANSTPEQDALNLNLGAVLVVQDFVADGDSGQCNGAAYGRIISQAASWSPPIRIDTDSRPGGCLYRIGIVDFNGALKATGFSLTMTFTADGDAGQCGGQGPHPVPISSNLNSMQLTAPIRMDMDNRPGGCVQGWSVTGNKVLFDLDFYADGDAGQCGNAGSHSAPPNFNIRLDTDDRPGGCLQSIRLRAAGRSFVETDGSSASGATTIFDDFRAATNSK